MMLKFWSMLFPLMSVINLAAVYSQQTGKFVPDATSGLCPQEDISFVTTLSTKLTCAASCFGDKGCMSFGYDTTNQQCTGCMRYSGLSSKNVEYLKIATQCPGGWQPYGKFCYYFDTTGLTFYDAWTACRNLGSYLVYVTSSAENNFIKGELRKISGTTECKKAVLQKAVLQRLKNSSNRPDAIDYWTALTELSTEGVFEWYNSVSTSTFRDFEEGQPNENINNEICVLFGPTAFKWFDRNCGQKSGYVCKKALML